MIPQNERSAKCRKESRMKKAIATEKAPGAIGPYSQAIAAGGMLYLSGQIAIDPASGTIEARTIEDQTRQAIENMRAILHAAGADLSDVVKTTVFLQDMDDFAAMNAVYGEYFPEPYPARSAVQVVRLPKGAMVEIEAVAVLA